ncbi:CRAL/TRIO domain-containing protein [Lojkania enalia]|uniref:CRAL/TRIO domain-containing protein n=1 Tax=Lojkania enalia TaxID=147567 RepID=A0A9P4K6I5_9PLEO|nr:CRAL/TRIO domain-containing protein [Didymosphaeria enalia]
MCLRVHTIRRIPAHTSILSSYIQAARRLSKQSQHRLNPAVHSPPSKRQAYHTGYHSAKPVQKRSGGGLFTTAVLLGIAIGGVLFYPLIGNKRNITEEIEKTRSKKAIDYSGFPDSYLVMASNMPAGRPGTLTPEQETKLRELWAATMKVFGVYEPATLEINGTETPLNTPSEMSETSSTTTATGGKEKKKSRLNVFKRHKDKGGKEDSSNPPSGSATPSDLSSLSLADEDDKYGQNKDFKAALENISPEDLRKTFWSMVKHDHPDGLLLRFLRARKWDVDKALIMMISTMHWRAVDMHVDDDIIRRGELAALEDSKSDDPKVKREGEDFLAQMRMGKSYLHGLDKEGRPICTVRVRLHKQGEQTESSLERFTVYTIETARMLLRPPVDTATIIFDMTNFSMANMDYTPVKFMIRCFEANYPESLGTVLVYKAPWVFNAIWNIIRGWLDPVVAGKVHFTKNVEELEVFVARSQIPAELGGDEKWEYQYVEPDSNENALMEDEVKREVLQTARREMVQKYESGVLDWVHKGENDDKSLEERREERDIIADDLRQNYWKLDPYLRARSLYDRVGIIGEGGRLNFYPVKSTPAPEVTQETSADDLD